MKLVMIHGRAQGAKDPVALKKEWMDALGDGLLRADAKLPPGTIVEFPYYGDELDRLIQEVATPLGSDALAKGTESDAEKGFRGELIEELAANAGMTRAEIDRAYAGEPREKGPLNWEWVQAILRAADRVPGLGSRVLDTFTRDVYVYLTYPGVRARIDQIVLDALGDAPCVLLTHSLGSIIAYHILMKRPGVPEVPRFVTVGSPLGLRSVQHHLGFRIGFPAPVRHWFNAYDDRDFVALHPLDAHNFNVAPPIENWGNVRNYTDNRHGIVGYLADPVVAAKSVELL